MRRYRPMSKEKVLGRRLAAWTMRFVHEAHLSEIGRLLGISRERVQQIIAKYDDIVLARIRAARTSAEPAMVRLRQAGAIPSEWFMLYPGMSGAELLPTGWVEHERQDEDSWAVRHRSIYGLMMNSYNKMPCCGAPVREADMPFSDQHHRVIACGACGATFTITCGGWDCPMSEDERWAESEGMGDSCHCRDRSPIR